MNFASPDNLAITGPLEQFGHMVRSKTFRALTTPDRVLVGQTKFIDGKARVLVTLVEGRKLSCFVWVLSKQEQPPFEDCWMTDGVFPVRFGEQIEEGSDRPNDVI